MLIIIFRALSDQVCLKYILLVYIMQTVGKGVSSTSSNGFDALREEIVDKNVKWFHYNNIDGHLQARIYYSNFYIKARNICASL